MRLKAFQELGVETVEISQIKPVSEAQKLKYALSDNDRAGHYDEQQLAELIHIHKSDIELGDYHVDLKKTASIGDVIGSVSPGSEPKEPFVNTGFEVIVECTDEKNQKVVFDKLTEAGYPCRILAF